jgi:hypothetical protein
MLLAALDAATAAGLGAHAFLLEDSEEAQADRAIARDSGSRRSRSGASS